MSVEKPTSEEVQNWIATNVRRIKAIRMLTVKDMARRMNMVPKSVMGIWRKDRMMNLATIVRLANALEMTVAELVSRPDNMEVVDHRSLTHLHWRNKAKLKATEEEQERQALLESLGLDE